MTRSTTQTSRDFGHRGRQRGQILTHNLTVSRGDDESHIMFMFIIYKYNILLCIYISKPSRRNFLPNDGRG